MPSNIPTRITHIPQRELHRGYISHMICPSFVHIGIFCVFLLKDCPVIVLYSVHMTWRVKMRCNITIFIWPYVYVTVSAAQLSRWVCTDPDRVAARCNTREGIPSFRYFHCLCELAFPSISLGPRYTHPLSMCHTHLVR